jgi:ATP-binding cassette subfamily B protein
MQTTKYLFLKGLGGNMRNRIIRDFFKKYWIGYVLGIVFLVLSSFVQTLTPRFLGIIIDLLDSKTINKGQVLMYTGFMLLAALAAFVTRFIWRNYIIGNGRNLECYLRQKLFEHFQTLSVEFYNNRKTGDLMAYAINDISAVRMTFGPGVSLIVNGVGLSAISVLSMVESVNIRLTILSLLPIPVIVFLMLRIGKIIRKRFRTVQENFASISDRVQENISGLRVIKSYVQEEREVDNFDELNNRMAQSNIKMVRISSILSPLTQAWFGVSFMINLIYGSSLVRSGVISLGDFVAFNGYLTMIMAPVISIGRVINIFQRGMASYKRISEILEVEPEIVDKVTDMPLNKIKGNIEIRGLNYAYPNSIELALKDIDLKIEKGQILGIIGKTGSGKTTLMNLLLRLYNVDEGKILLDGKDINDFTLETLRENVGYVPQDNFLFSATIEENITFFKDAYSDEEIENAAKMSLIYQSIMEFPEKFSTVVGERGVNLSGGQKQRISIARAIIKNPSILILDDALSAVDMKTEEEILKNLKTVMNGRTGIIIANRISAIRHADHIIEMEHGKITERGTHEQLVKNKKLYYELYQEQYKAEQGKKVKEEYEECKVS